MTFKTADRIYETSVTTGTGTYTLDGAVTGFQAFSTLSNGNTCSYFATDDLNWEIGIGTVGTGPNTLARTTILASSNAGAAVNWGAGTRKIRCGLPASMAIPRTQSKSVAGSSNVALTQDEQRRDYIELTGALTGNIDVTVDATPWKWVVYNNTTGDFTITFKVTGQTGTVIARGERRDLYCDGTDVRSASLPYVDNPSRPNLLINPNWQIDQINEGALYTVNTTDVRGPGWLERRCGRHWRIQAAHARRPGQRGAEVPRDLVHDGRRRHRRDGSVRGMDRGRGIRRGRAPARHELGRAFLYQFKLKSTPSQACSACTSRIAPAIASMPALSTFRTRASMSTACRLPATSPARGSTRTASACAWASCWPRARTSRAPRGLGAQAPSRPRPRRRTSCRPTRTSCT
jgi:hypothetical protein